MVSIGNMWFRTGTNAWGCKVDGKWKSLVKGRENEAQAKLEYAKLVVKLSAEQSETNQISDNTQVKVIFGLYTDHFINKPPLKTLLQKSRYKDMFLERFGEHKVRDLKHWQIQDWFDERKTWNSTTKLWILRMYNHVFSWALNREYITRNPIRAVAKPTALVRGEDVVISDENFAKLRSKAAPYLRNIIDALWYTGCRPSEILTAHSSEYDSVAHVLDKNAHKTSGKGCKRKIQLPKPIVDIIEDRLKKCPDGPLFPGNNGKTLVSGDFYNRLQNLKKRAGITGKILPYGFRHTYACRLILAGIPDVHVATLLGHTSTKHLHRNYAHTLAMAKGMSTSLDMVQQVMSGYQQYQQQPVPEVSASSFGDEAAA